MAGCHRTAAGLGGLALLTLAACAPTPKDYSAFRAHMPKSVLVLPPTNQSVEVNAPYSYLSTVSEPLGEAGYYVFPVAVVDTFMKDNGLPDPADMHDVPIAKLREVFGADAVLYIDITRYGQEYEIISSSAVVRARARLVDTATGMAIWEGEASGRETSSSTSSNALVSLLTAAVAQAAGTTVDKAHEVAREANQQMISSRSSGFLQGPRSRDFGQDERGRAPAAPASAPAPAQTAAN